LRLVTSLLSLVADDPLGARRQCRDAMALWRPAGRDITAFTEWTALVAIELYEDDAVACGRRCEELTELLAGPAAVVPLWRGRVLSLRALAAICAAAAAEHVEPLITRALGDLDAVEALGLPCFSDAVKLARAGVAELRGQRELCLSLLDAVLGSAEAQAQPLLVASALRRRGELMGGPADPLALRADEIMRERGVANPERMVRLFAPGFCRALR
jgi:hypothetical protein